MNWKKRARPVKAKTAAVGQPQGRSLLGAGILGMVLGLVLGGFLFSLRTNSSGSSESEDHGAPTDGFGQTTNADWGDLISQRITIERPEEFVPEILGIPAKASWFIGPREVQSWLSVLASADVTDGQREDLATNRWQAMPEGWIITPSTNTLSSLNRRARTQLYGILARFSENPSHQFPYRFPLSRENEWFNNSGLPPEIEAEARKMVYARGRSACFSDVELINRLATVKERQQLVRVLSREPAVFVKLQVRPTSDLERIVKYWEKAKPRKDIEPFLASLARSPDDTDISITYFLPPFARTRLYCYPDQLSDEPNSQDCYWSALNFFNQVPDRRYLSNAGRDEALKNNYQVVKAPPILGDLILLVDKGGHPIHAAVYLADNIVFTKNGATRMSPWLLMEINDMVSYYAENSYQLVVMRPRPAAGNAAGVRSFQSP